MAFRLGAKSLLFATEAGQARDMTMRFGHCAADVASRYPHSTCLAAGLCFASGLPPLGLWWLACPGFCVFLFLMSTSSGRVLSQIYAFALGYFIFALHWIGFAFFVDGDTNPALMPIAVGGLAAFLSVYWVVGVAVLSFAKAVPPVARVVTGIAVAEWARGTFFTGFPWAVPGLMAEAMGPLAQGASVVGMHGLTVLVLAWMALPWLLWCGWRDGQKLEQRRVASLAVLAVSLLLAMVFGWWRVAEHPTEVVQGQVIRLVQPNIAQGDKWRAENAEAVFAQLLAQSSRGAEAAGVTHVVWPESALAFLLDEQPTALQRVGEALGGARHLLTGAIRRDKPASGQENYYTSIMLVDGHGVVRDRYDKWRLVPGGEFLPFEDLLAKINLRKLVSLPESFTPGPGPRNMQVPGLGSVGMAICYEAIFPQRFVADDRPVLMVNVTNDGWFGRSVGPDQHFSQVRLRAIEQGLPIARAANTGVSGMIDGVGRITARTLLENKAVLDVPVPKALSPTVFATWGRWMVVLTLVGVFISLFFCQKNAPQRHIEF